MSSKLAFATAATLRASLICYASWVDAHSDVKYTDIDYSVFTDAAAYTSQGLSPYHRSTYRYSPFLAMLLVPNVLLHPAWGKVLFCLADLLVARYARRWSLMY